MLQAFDAQAASGTSASLAIGGCPPTRAVFGGASLHGDFVAAPDRLWLPS